MTPSVMFGMRDKPVMIIEDDADLREVMAALLEMEGYSVVVAFDGSDAMTLLADGARPFLILLDWMMPNMDGEAFRNEQLATPTLAGIPVVILSAAPSETLLRTDPAPSPPLMMHKPIDFSMLLEVVAGYHAASVAPR